ncbi:DUF1638 domain-containing protein [Desulfosporosinus youngiae]|uniref:DUF1638 domain-containing protein n=1 Tax=Desulfosporosinus youngiae DSM 17734 TaxID=768710 RepID=H5XS15_9FIRM|nr:DUF1638 domain-containing protein [Desulfosporosinus youngiae]EHQ87627.1 Protein of unknown function (DUF1638) [Desulfosporosinus youngiae DSM 17734]
MKIKLIGCHSTMNEVRAQVSGQGIDCEFLDYSFHAQPEKLHAKLQEIINESQAYDLIILTYGRCSNSMVGLLSPHVPLLFPATHDCIGLMLGSTTRHMELFKENSLTYYFSQGWLDYGRTPLAEYYEYETQFGEKKARKLIKMLYGRYQKAVFIKTPGINDPERYQKKVREIADFFGWEVGEIEGDISLLSSVVRGIKVPESIYIEAGQVITLELLAGGRQKNND